jgi:hypothetical protein
MAVARNPYIAPGDIDIYDVLKAEITAINGRRAKKARPLLPVGTIYRDKQNVLDAVGLALSGGGIRSAAFSLGVLQALNQQGVIDRVDYLSTVSGGGYIGGSMTASMSVTGGEFAFGSKSEEGGAPPIADISDTDAVAHIRNYSNYLIPFGLRDVLSALAIIVRGLVANLAWLLPWILFLAAATIALDPQRADLSVPVFSRGLADPPQMHFSVTITLALVGIFGFLLWAIYRSRLKPEDLAEFRQGLPAYGGLWLALIAIALVLEFQPFVLAQMFDAADRQQAGSSSSQFGGLFGLIVQDWVQKLTAFSASLWVLVKFFQDHFQSAIEAGGTTSRWRTWLAGITAQATVWVAGAALPLIIWLAYLYLCFWGIADGTHSHAPWWLAAAAGWIRIGWPGTGEPWLYLAVGIVLWLVAKFWLKPNANSLHRLYRDRISKAFLFNPEDRIEDSKIAGARDFEPLDPFPLTALSPDDAPYHLINTTLNIQSVDFANRRGRNADFFLVSSLYVGSIATGYAPTTKVVGKAPDFDLGTAIAVSGAAASADMGSLTIRALTPTLALLNVRLAYWLSNPYYLREPIHRLDWEEEAAQSSDFMWAEMFGKLNETGKNVYLSDGGHIENLGLYELLRRKCRLIIAVDCDKDGEMTMPSFVTVQRYARIDLGIRISLPWQKIAETTLAWMGVGANDKKAPEGGETRGPHVAIGKIDYGAGEAGYLVYVKPSLTGDENDYISDYARRHADYPHESTGDQFFSEEQFEVYRALGFHAMFGFLSGTDDVIVHGELPSSGPPAAQRSAGSQAAAAVFAVLPSPQAAAEPPKHPPVVDDHQVMSGKDPVLKPVRDLLGLTG